MPPHARAKRLLASAALAAVLALSAAACTTTGSETTGSIGTPSNEGDWRKSADVWGERYRQNPGDSEAAIRYAQALRATGRRVQAVAVLEQASIRNPHDMPLLGAYGRALADAGDYVQALDVLGRAHSTDAPDWKILNAQGAVLDQMGRHSDAQRHYATALKIAPNEPSVLSNLGLSYALSKDLKRAEATLKRAVAEPRAEPKVRQNLALVVGLEGRFAEAEKIARADLPEDEAVANVAYLRQMLSQKDEWKNLGVPRVPLPQAGN